MFTDKIKKSIEERHELLKTMSEDKFSIQGIIRILVSSIKPILAPSYLLFPEITEEEQIKSAKKTYGV